MKPEASEIARLRREVVKLKAERDILEKVAGELAHRNRNSLFIIMSIVSQSAKDASSATEAANIINSRLAALLRAQDLLVQSDAGTIGLMALVQKALEPFGPERFDIADSPDVPLAADVGNGLSLMFHELATNAVKHGALSAPRGRIFIAWELSGDKARLTWREEGGPPVLQPGRRGFGTRLFEVALLPQGGKAERRFERDGLICELTIPAPPNPPRFLTSVLLRPDFAQDEPDSSVSA